MSDFASQSEKIEILQCKNGMLTNKFGFNFLTRAIPKTVLDGGPETG